MPLSQIKTNSIAAGNITPALISSLSGLSVANTAITGTIIQSQIANNAIGRNQIANDAIGRNQIADNTDLKGKGLLLEPINFILATANRWILWWQKFDDGRYYHGTFSVTNYTQPAAYYCTVHNSYNNATGLGGFAVTRNYGAQNVSWKRVTYNGVQYLATYNSGETNREYYWSGWHNVGSSFAPFSVSSVTTDHETYGTP